MRPPRQRSAASRWRRGSRRGPSARAARGGTSDGRRRSWGAVVGRPARLEFGEDLSPGRHEIRPCWRSEIAAEGVGSLGRCDGERRCARDPRDELGGVRHSGSAQRLAQQLLVLSAPRTGALGPGRLGEDANRTARAARSGGQQRRRGSATSSRPGWPLGSRDCPSNCPSDPPETTEAPPTRGRRHWGAGIRTPTRGSKGRCAAVTPPPNRRGEPGRR